MNRHVPYPMSPHGWQRRGRCAALWLALVGFTLITTGTALCEGTPTVLLNGQAELDLKFDNLSGSGTALRQEPDSPGLEIGGQRVSLVAAD